MLEKIKFLWGHTLVVFLWRWMKQWNHERRLRATTERTVEGVRLSVAGLSPKLTKAISSGRYEQSEVELCRAVVGRGARVLELGSAIGFIGLFCRTQLAASRCVSVEANPNTAERLRVNYQLNGLVAELIVAAISDRDGVARMHVDDDFRRNRLADTETKQGREIEVRAVSLPTLLREVGSDFDVLVVDVEGAETAIEWLALPSSITTIVIELHPDLVGFPAAFKVLQGLQNEGFDVCGIAGCVYCLRRSAANSGTGLSRSARPDDVRHQERS